MSRIFLSHSSIDEREAFALKQWLADNGWDDVFLDVDPQRGLVAGERWQEALRKAANRCEAVVFLVSPAWAGSKWCLGEFLLASNLGKLIFSVVIREVPMGELPPEMTSEWQLCRLIGSGPAEAVRFTHREIEDELTFQSDGLKRLKDGLRKAGINADFFPWPPRDDPNRAPYRGLEPLEPCDAAIFFGRDVEILSGLKALRGMRDSIDRKLFIILGASGAGKSSFLRAGLLPRLARDDRHFFPLAPIRPEREPLFGDRGLASALHQAHVMLDLSSTNLGDIKGCLREGPAGLAQLLRKVQQAARARLITSSGDPAPPTPTLVVPVDQAEELFNADAGDEARTFLELLGAVLRANASSKDSGLPDVPMILAFTVRSDRYEPLQTAPELAGLRSVAFDDLKPMPPTRYREVILGPAGRASVQGGRLEVKPDLVERLVAECAEGGDALPLLGLTLARLYRDYASDGDLRLDEYEAMGGLSDIVRREGESILAADEATRAQQLALLRAAFIPWLATINPKNDQPMRRVARLSDLPPESRSLVDALAEKRLLLRDERENRTIVEIAHDALLRQWKVLAEWLEIESEALKEADALERAAQAWAASGFRDPWLFEGERLSRAESLAARPGFRERLEGCRAFLFASRQRDDARRAEEERRSRAELEAAQRLAAEQKDRADAEARRADAEVRRKRNARIALAIVAGLLVFAIMAFEIARRERQSAQSRLASLLWFNGAHERDDNIDPLKAGHYFMHASAVVGDETAAKHALLAASLVTGDVFLEGILEHEHPVKTASFSQDEGRVTSWSDDGEMRVWDSNSGARLDAQRFGGAVGKLHSSPAGKRILLSMGDGGFQVRDSQSGALLVTLNHEPKILKFSADENRLLTWDPHEHAQVWDMSLGRRISLLAHERPVRGAVMSRSGDRALTWGEEGPACLWDAGRGEKLRDLPLDRAGIEGAAFGMDESRLLIWDKQGTVRLWDARGKHIDIPLPSGGFFHPALRADFFQNDERILVLNHGGLGKVHVKNSRNGDLLASFDEHEGAVSKSIFTRNQNLILTWGDERAAWLWDSRDDAKTKNFSSLRLEHKETVLGATFTEAETQVLTWSMDGTAMVRDSRNGQLLGQMKHGAAIRGAAFSRDNRRILTWSEDGSARIWRIRDETGSVQLAHEEPVLGAAYIREEDQLLTMSKDSRLRLWSSRGEPLGSLEFTSGIRGARFSSDEKVSRVLTWEGDGTIRVWNTRSGESVAAPFRHEVHDDPDSVGAAFGPDERWVLSWADGGTARVWDSQTGSRVCEKQHGASVTLPGAHLSWDGSRLLTWTDDRKVTLWDKDHEKPLCTLPHDFEVKGAALTKDGSRILSWSSDGIGRVWDSQRCEEPVTFRHEKAIRGAGFDRSEDRILSWSEDGVGIWNSRQSNTGLTPALPQKNALGGVFSSGEKQVLTWGGQGMVRIWDSRTGYPLTPRLCFRHDGGPIDSAAFIYDDQKLLIVSHKTVWVWTLPMDHERLARQPAFFHQSKADQAQAEQEVITGTRLNDAKEIEVLSSAEWEKSKSQLGLHAPPSRN